RTTSSRWSAFGCTMRQTLPMTVESPSSSTRTLPAFLSSPRTAPGNARRSTTRHDTAWVRMESTPEHPLRSRTVILPVGGCDGRPVNRRQQMFSFGHRPATWQRVALGAAERLDVRPGAGPRACHDVGQAIAIDVLARAAGDLGGGTPFQPQLPHAPLGLGDMLPEVGNRLVIGGSLPSEPHAPHEGYGGRH